MSRRSSDALLMLAARAPIPGETKTRLGAAIGMERAAALYRAFLQDIAAQFDPDPVHGQWDVAWTYSPPDCDFRSEIADVTGRTRPSSTQFVPQAGPDWGVRQANLLSWGRQSGYQRVVLMATDSPQLSHRDVERAFLRLEDHDVVLGRVRDGGYYLIGVSGSFDLLSGVRMSTASAADGVVNAATAQGLTVGEVAVTFDVDEVGDLEHLRESIARDPDRCPATARAMHTLGLHESNGELA